MAINIFETWERKFVIVVVVVTAADTAADVTCGIITTLSVKISHSTACQNPFVDSVCHEQ